MPSDPPTVRAPDLVVEAYGIVTPPPNQDTPEGCEEETE